MGKTHPSEMSPEEGYSLGKDKKEGDIRKHAFKGSAELDLTDTSSTATLIPQDAIPADFGGDVVVATQIEGLVTEAVAADNTAPIVTVEDTNGNSTGLTITLTDGDAVDDYVTASLADGDATTPVDLTSEGMRAKVTTAAADAGTATGKVKVVVEAMFIE